MSRHQVTTTLLKVALVTELGLCQHLFKAQGFYSITEVPCRITVKKKDLLLDIALTIISVC